jgi:hypothetical protein
MRYPDVGTHNPPSACHSSSTRADLTLGTLRPWDTPLESYKGFLDALFDDLLME